MKRRTRSSGVAGCAHVTALHTSADALVRLLARVLSGKPDEVRWGRISVLVDDRDQRRHIRGRRAFERGAAVARKRARGFGRSRRQRRAAFPRLGSGWRAPPLGI
jgi:hypothetical protein